MSAAKRRGSAGMDRPSNAAWVLPPAVQIPGVARAGGAAAAGAGTPRSGPAGGPGRRTGPLAATRRPAESGRSPPGNIPGAASPRRGMGRAEGGGSEPAWRAGPCPRGRTAAWGAGDPDRPRRPGAGGTPGAGGAGQRPLDRGLEAPATEAPTAKPAVRRQAGRDGDERHEREPRVALRGEIEDVPLPALPADQEVQRVFVQVGERDFEDPRGVSRVLGVRGWRQQQARGQQDQTPHLDEW